ncbi:phytoene/squalene synthase family protein [Wenzhouxiangella sp. XN79A]|uniref:phytoene/squalene synthase family protein n=1 Tax=Wenzhouxiangella sp. XN79A TaxID=2724193 RepID=UPI00144AF606|nr:phytoene/squalene synthase family protein [Wenzhouxiangella sp. XN79A]NKI34004.1 phytoene/squalene synthase family protein [Wenzhouxiangella sp. XN79A]
MALRPSDDALGREAAETIAEGSKSFATASKLFRPAMRRDVLLLYAWCRHCDDVTDGQDLGRNQSGTASPQTIDRLKQDSLAACRGRPNDELPYRALAEVARRHELPEDIVLDHIAGFEQDVAGWQPQSTEDLLEYCYFVAGAVGILMARIMGVRDIETLKRASDLGLAFQLTNIARDIVEDARAGRCYLPRDWRQLAQLDIPDLPDPDRARDVHPLAAQLVELAEPYYASARIGERALPGRAAWAIATARSVYRDIGLQVRRKGPDGLAERAYTSKGRKIWRVVTGGSQTVGGRLLKNGRAPVRDGLWTPRALAG